MTLSEFAKGSATFAVAIVAGYLSTAYVDQHYASPKVSKWATPASNPAPQWPPSACIGWDGSWKNWLWPNVPTLSPKCKDQ